MYPALCVPCYLPCFVRAIRSSGFLLLSVPVSGLTVPVFLFRCFCVPSSVSRILWIYT